MKVSGKTETGFKFSIDDRVLDDWRLIQNIELAESENLTERVKGTNALVRLLLGDNEEKLMEHIAKKNDGFIPSSAVTSELASIIKATRELKNSQSSHTS